MFIKKYKIHKRNTTQAQWKIVVLQKFKIMGRKKQCNYTQIEFLEHFSCPILAIPSFPAYCLVSSNNLCSHCLSNKALI